MDQKPILAQGVPAQDGKTIYPEPFATMVKGRTKRKLGDYFGLANIGINLTEMSPGSISALFHYHSKQDEFIYVLEGNVTLVAEHKEFILGPGECFGVKAGSGIGCQLINKSDGMVKILEIGDRSKGDEVVYPNDDLILETGASGEWIVKHKDGSPY